MKKRVSGSDVTCASTSLSITAGTYYRYRIDITGEAITVYRDGVQRLTWTDSSPLAAGPVGVIAGYSLVYFDNVVSTNNVSPAQVVSYDDFDPWGMTLGGRSSNAGDSRQRYRYIGKERDSETGLDWLDARGYDSRIGRFMSVDPLAMEFHAWSPYHYSFDNLTRFWDPTGMEPEDEEEEQKGRQKEDKKSLGAKSAAGLTLPTTLMAFRIDLPTLEFGEPTDPSHAGKRLEGVGSVNTSCSRS